MTDAELDAIAEHPRFSDIERLVAEARRLREIEHAALDYLRDQQVYTLHRGPLYERLALLLMPALRAALAEREGTHG